MKKLVLILLGVWLLATSLWACRQAEESPLIVYSGRSETLVEPLIERFEQETGISVEVRYGDTAQLAVALTEEGEQTQADLFWAQDAGALGAVDARGLFTSLADTVLRHVPAALRSNAGRWVATSGRARTLAYAPGRIDTMALPQSLFELTDPQYAGRVGWAPTNGSFQAHVTALRKMVGDDSTRAWLQAMLDNGTKSYRNNTAIVQAIADGEVDLGLPNHYYLYRFKSEDPAFPVEQRFFAPGDPGNLMNVAGIGILAGTDQPERAQRFVAFLLTDAAQRYFSEETYEYPVVDGVVPAVALPDWEGGRVLPQFDLDVLQDLEGTLQLLRSVGLL